MGRLLINRTPLIAAFFVSALALAACRQSTGVRELAAGTCEQEHTAISEIQGDSTLSPMLGKEVYAKGVVTLVTPAIGLFIEQALADESVMTSNAIFIQSPALAAEVSEGDQLVAYGLVAEIGERSDTMTSLTKISGYRVCQSHLSLPETNIDLPLSAVDREALEGMHLHIRQELVISNVYDAKDGLLTVNLGGMRWKSTQVARPGPDARAQSVKNRLSSLDIVRMPGNRPVWPAGTRIMALHGVMGHDGKSLRLVQKEALQIIPSNASPLRSPEKDHIRVVGFNLLNYFNGNGKGGGFPTPRGAKTAAEFLMQRGRLSAAIGYIKPHLVAVMELENDGFSENSAAQDFIADLQSAGSQSWRVVVPQEKKVGSDVISVGIFYDEDRLAPIGQAELLTAPPFEHRSRVPMAQLFREKNSGELFYVVVNHFKSKGSCPDEGRNANLKDGQGCWNLARTQAAKAMSRWIESLASKSSEGKALILGDMNAYRMEDPITTIIEAGFKDLKAASAMEPGFSHIFWGEAGTLDYAFASEELRPHVWSTRILNINSPYPTGVELPQPWLRSSDHDPVVIDLRFRQSATPD